MSNTLYHSCFLFYITPIITRLLGLQHKATGIIWATTRKVWQILP